jgi:hypothetical protein
MVSDLFKALAGFAGLSDKIAAMVQEGKWKKAGKDEVLLKQEEEYQAMRDEMRNVNHVSKSKERRKDLQSKYGEKS